MQDEGSDELSLPLILCRIPVGLAVLLVELPGLELDGLVYGELVQHAVVCRPKDALDLRVQLLDLL